MTSAAEIITSHNEAPRDANQAIIIMRLLDPEPLSDEEIERQVEWGWETDMSSFINFHHPFYIGFVPEDLEQAAEHFSSEDYDTLAKATDPYFKIPAKHEHMHLGKMDSGIWLFERPYRPIAAYLLIRKGLFRDDDEGLADWIRMLWTDTESASSNAWHLLLEAYPLSDPHDPDELLDPSGTTTVYRGVGVPDDEEPGDFGASWTTEKEKAEWFARRFSVLDERRNPYLLTGEVKNELVMFTTDGRGESEVVSHAVQVTEVERL